ncbi:MAG: 50S ribosomal protein L25 [Patescibacteria group bacterium]
MELTASKRTVSGKGLVALRKAGKMPAVVYGAKDEALSIELSQREFTNILKDAGESTIVALSIDGMEKNVLIHDVDYDPLTNEPRHVDFYAVQKGQKVEVSVPLEFSGVAPVVKELGANVVKVLHELEVEADAMNLPHELMVDIGSLTTLESQITAKDINLPSGVVLVTDPEEVIAIVAMPEEEPVEPVAAVDMATIGISEERGKKEEEAPAPDA